MIVLGSIGHPDAYYYFIQETGVRQIDAIALEVFAGLEHEFIDAGLEIFTFQQRRFTTAIAVGAYFPDQVAATGQPVKFNPDFPGRVSCHGIQNVCGHLSHELSFSLCMPELVAVDGDELS